MLRRTVSIISIILILLGIILFSACRETKWEQINSDSPLVSENPHVRDLSNAELLDFVAGPQGIRIGDSLESVLQCFPQEYDYAY